MSRRGRSGRRRSGGGRAKGGGISGKTVAIVGIAGIAGYLLYEKMHGSMGAAHAAQTAAVKAANPNLPVAQASVTAAGQMAQQLASFFSGAAPAVTSPTADQTAAAASAAGANTDFNNPNDMGLPIPYNPS